jgi:hypothetical protein
MLLIGYIIALSPEKQAIQELCFNLHISGNTAYICSPFRHLDIDLSGF